MLEPLPVITVADRAPQPNIVFILADDLGWADLGCYGSTEISTPNIDRLAAGGVRFTHAYSASPWCSQTRVALYTGRYPGRLSVGLEEPLTGHNQENGIPAEHPTLPSMLQNSGYATAMFGKWHCGWLPWHSPLRIGFGTFFGNLGGALDYFGHFGSLGLPDLYEGETPVDEVGYYTSMISNRAAEFVREERSEPFYVQLNYTAPHWPWEGPADEATSETIRSRYESGEDRFPLFHLDGGSLAKYGEMVEAMDAGIGEVLDALDETGQTDDTIIIFTSDNGGERWSKNWPFIGEKGDLTEGGIRVPFVLRWPNAVASGQVNDAASITMDWTATLLAAAGTSPDPSYPLDGENLLSWLTSGASYPDHDLFWRIASQGAVRRGRNKYLRDHRDRAVVGNWPREAGQHDFLFDVTVDGREAADIKRNNEDELAELSAAWDQWASQLLPIPEGHPNLPNHGGNGQQRVSQPD